MLDVRFEVKSLEGPVIMRVITCLHDSLSLFKFQPPSLVVRLPYLFLFEQSNSITSRYARDTAQS